MFLRDFPPHLNPGRVPLELVKPGFSLMVMQCDTCEMFSPRSYICACGHDFCAGCAIPISGEGLWIRCSLCQKRVPATPIELQEDFMKALIFACCCGFKGTLEEIRIHVTEDEDHELHEQIADFKLPERITSPLKLRRSMSQQLRALNTK